MYLSVSGIEVHSSYSPQGVVTPIYHPLLVMYVDSTSLDKTGLHCLNVAVSIIGGFQVNAFNAVLINEVDTGVVRTAMHI